MARHLTLYDFRDLDFMLKVREVGNEEGWASSQEIAEALGMDEDAKAVGSRSSWMRRYGVFDYDEQKKLWRLSSGGERVVNAKLRASQANTIEKIPDESMVDVMAHVTSRYRLGDPIMATMLRREFLFGTSTRSSVWDGKKRR